MASTAVFRKKRLRLYSRFYMADRKESGKRAHTTPTKPINPSQAPTPRPPAKKHATSDTDEVLGDDDKEVQVHRHLYILHSGGCTFSAKAIVVLSPGITLSPPRITAVRDISRIPTLTISR